MNKDLVFSRKKENGEFPLILAWIAHATATCACASRDQQKFAETRAKEPAANKTAG